MLGSLEKKVVSAVEDLGEANISEIVDELHSRDVDVAYTTVSTVLDRLYEKDMVDRRKEPFRGGSRYVYMYVDIQDEYLSKAIDNVMTVFGERGVASLVNNISDIEEQDLEEIKDDLGLDD